MDNSMPSSQKQTPKIILKVAPAAIVRVEDWTIQRWQEYLHEKQWLKPQSQIVNVIRLPGGNMNFSLKISHDSGEIFIKQGRPWVEKYPQFEAPWGRTSLEADFYLCTRGAALIRDAMPEFIGIDPELQVLATQWIADTTEASSIYTEQSGSQFLRQHSEFLLSYLAALNGSEVKKLEGRFDQNPLKPLNSFHIFDYPFQEEQLQAAETASEQKLDWLRDARFTEVRDEMKADYLGTGDHFLHGDFYPGSLMIKESRPVVIDPEFCMMGRSEFDAGNLFGHLILAGAKSSEIEIEWSGSRYFQSLDLGYLKKTAGIEILRRILGVAKVREFKSPEAFAALIESARALLLQ